ncbi:MAG: DUF92 domain-containing protein [Candidatus Wallbacteria bacterium]|nr:DUF92 domain-containing protein [Candidatus Wallbacteria bacterium]
MRSELARKAIHAGFGLAALLLRWLSWQQAAAVAATALAFNLTVFPALGARRLYRAREQQLGWSPGMVAYPAAVLALVVTLPLPAAAAIWAMMAFGDAGAALAGALAGGPRLPWNPSKSWAGLAAFIPSATLPAMAFYTWCAPAAAPPGAAVFWVTAAVCAAVESLPLELPDNLTIPLVGAPLFMCLAAVAELPAAPAVGWGPALATNAALVVGSVATRTLDLSGAVAAFGIGVAVLAAAGWGGYTLLLGFFVLGSLATRMGRDTKASLGIAQSNQGARSARNALANGAVPAFMAVMSAVDPDRAPLFLAAFASSLAAATFDTVSSEVGEWLCGRTYRILSFEPCAPGQDGGVSLEGTLAGLAAAALISVLAVACSLVRLRELPLVLLAASLGATVDSLLGDGLERTGWLDNEAVNFACTYAAAMAAFVLATLGAGA